MKKITLIIWVYASLLPIAGFTQATVDSLSLLPKDPKALSYQLILKKQGTSILLRWAPTQASIWLNGLKGKIQVERISFESFQKFKNAKTEILSADITPWSQARFQEQIKLHPENRFLPMAFDLIYGDWETVKKKQELTMGTILASREELMHKYSAALFIADMDLLAAEALGLQFSDKNPPPKNYLLYRITAYDGKKIPMTTQALYNPNFNPQIVPNIDQAESEDGFIRLSWDRKEHERYFTAYYIERSTDGKTFTRLNELPYINAVDQQESFGIPPISYLAKAENGKLYHYRILGIDAFGQISDPSKSIPVKATDKTAPPAPVRLKAEWKNDKWVELSWQQDSIVPDFKGYQISKSLSPEGPFQEISKINSTNIKNFKDDQADRVNGTYYQVCAIDESGNKNCGVPVYAFFNDRTPPPVPQGLTGSIDTNGVVRLRWSLGNTPDISGYHVYAANGSNQVFTRKNKAPIKDTLWTDTLSLKTLTEKIYYRITAVDLRSNISDFSSSLTLIKPDRIAPSAPVFTGYRTMDKGVEISWINSNSKDLQYHSLLRRTPETSWEEIAKMSKGEKSFQDFRTQAKNSYEYQIIAVDDAGNKTPGPITLKIQTLPAPVLLAPLQVQNSDTGTVLIELDLGTQQEPIAQIVIYKSEDHSEFKLWKALPFTSKLTLKDQGTTQRYKYRLVYQDGRKSAYSPIASLIKGN